MFYNSCHINMNVYFWTFKLDMATHLYIWKHDLKNETQHSSGCIKMNG